MRLEVCTRCATPVPQRIGTRCPACAALTPPRQPHTFYRSRAWLRVRLACLAEHGYLCVRCGQPGTADDPLVVHHRIARRRRPDLALELSNLEPVHRSEHPEHEAEGRRR